MIPNHILNEIDSIVENIFNKISMDFLGIIPNVNRDGAIFLTQNATSLVSLFLDGIGSNDINADEDRVLRNLLVTTNGYLESLKSNTKARLNNRLNGYATTQDLSKEDIKSADILKILEEELNTARNKMEVIVNSESKSAKNISMALQISRIAEEQGVERPVVYFKTIFDERTAEQPEKDLFNFPGTRLPRLFYLDELVGEYWKKEIAVPSIHGGHPNCRCVLTFLPTDYQVREGGGIRYASPGYQDILEQRRK